MLLLDSLDLHLYANYFKIIHEIYLILEILRKSIFFQKYYPIGVAEADRTLSSLMKPSRDLSSLAKTTSPYRLCGRRLVACTGKNSPLVLVTSGAYS